MELEVSRMPVLLANGVGLILGYAPQAHREMQSPSTTSSPDSVQQSSSRTIRDWTDQDSN